MFMMIMMMMTMSRLYYEKLSNGICVHRVFLMNSTKSEKLARDQLQLSPQTMPTEVSIFELMPIPPPPTKSTAWGTPKLFTHTSIKPVQKDLTLMNRQELMFSLQQ